MSKKHKEVKRWAAGCETWGDQIIVVQGTLVETDKQFRLKLQPDRTLASTERQFSFCANFGSRWDKEVYPNGPGYATRDGALLGHLNYLSEKVEEAERSLAARNREVDNMEKQMIYKTFKVIA